jgi:hypothetical protein
MPNPPILMTAQELAAELGRPYSSVLEWSKRGIIPSLRVGNRLVFDRDKSILALCKAREAESMVEQPA